jgi:hypothetical protein
MSLASSLEFFSAGSQRRSRRALAADLSNTYSRRWRRRALLMGAAVTSASVWLATGVPAVAAYYNTFDINGASGYGGSGRTYGSIEFFPSPKTQMRIGGNIGDICLADSKGWQMQALVLQNNGAYWRRTDVMHDYNDCGNGWEQLSPPQDFFAPGAINQARAELWVTEQGSPLFSVAQSAWKVHP